MKDLFQHRPSRLILLLVLTIGWLTASAQSLSVESFRALDNDLTANTRGTMKYDQNGEVAALIKVVTTENDFNFDIGSLGVVATSQQKGEIWVYVPGGAQRITITHAKLGVLRDYYFPIPIVKARTYELKLISGTVHTIVEQASTSQFVVFKVEPKTAVVFIDDDEPRALDSDGMLSIRLGRGHHTYRVTAASFVPESGAIEVESDKINKQVTLKSAKATLTVNTADGAEIWINETKKGVGSWTGDLEAGVYLVESRKTSHRSQKQEITLNQQEQRTVTISDPIPMYGSLEIESSPLECNVYVDNKLMGETPLILDKVLVGEHRIRLEKDGYQKLEAKTTVEEGKADAQKYTLQEAPKVEEVREYVDLGLSVKWATCNVGASKPEDYGDYFAWGEIKTKSNYAWDNYAIRASGDSYSNIKFSKYNTQSERGAVDNITKLDLSDDVANQRWGGSWRMPTKAEQDELRNNCTWTWTTMNGVKGYKVSGNKTGYRSNYIFLPAAGRIDGDKLQFSKTDGYYWSSTLNTSNPNLSYYITFDKDKVDWHSVKRYIGQPIRPVHP
jgi:hypothetical protein